MIPGYTKEQALSEIERIAQDTLPPGYVLDYTGESREIRREGNTMVGVLGASLIMVFLVLALQFDSFRDPLIILLGSAPLALFAAMVITFTGFTTINIYSQVGLITLVGLISKNAILIVDFANQAQIDGLSKVAAIKGASMSRLRPVLMTTGATVFGHFPLVLVTGAGAEARNSIGFILVIGMLIGTLFTLILLPAIYSLLASDHHVTSQIDPIQGAIAVNDRPTLITQNLTRRGCTGLIRGASGAKPVVAQVAQSVEQWIENPRVGGSIPPLGTISPLKTKL